MVLHHKTGGLVGGWITQHDNCFTIHLWSRQQIKCGSRDLLAVTWWLITPVTNKVQARNSSSDQPEEYEAVAGRQRHTGIWFWKCTCLHAELGRTVCGWQLVLLFVSFVGLKDVFLLLNAYIGLWTERVWFSGFFYILSNDGNLYNRYSMICLTNDW